MDIQGSNLLKNFDLNLKLRTSHTKQFSQLYKTSETHPLRVNSTFDIYTPLESENIFLNMKEKEVNY